MPCWAVRQPVTTVAGWREMSGRNVVAMDDVWMTTFAAVRAGAVAAVLVCVTTGAPLMFPGVSLFGAPIATAAALFSTSR